MYAIKNAGQERFLSHNVIKKMFLLATAIALYADDEVKYLRYSLLL